MNNVSSDLKNGGEMVHVILLQVLRVLYVLKRVMFWCQEVDFSQSPSPAVGKPGDPGTER